MKCHSEMLALLAAAVLAMPALADAPRAARPASKYAAQQVKIPAEEVQSAPAKSAAKTQPVRQAAHNEALSPPRGAQPKKLARGGAVRTASRAREHSIVVQDGEMDSVMMPEQIPAGETMMNEGETVHHGGSHGMFDPGYVGGDCHGGACGDCGDCGQCRKCVTCCVPCITLDNVEFFAGVDGFTGPLNRGAGGSFGFHEGVNWGRALPCQDIFSAQLGAQAIQSTFSGSDITDESRQQVFVTGGIFRRVDWGLQGGVVADFLRDEWYYEGIDLAQIRGEVSWVFPCGHELGFWFTHGISGTTGSGQVQVSSTASISVVEDWRSNDLYAFFYRKQFESCGASGRVFGGFTDDSDGLVGADFYVPLAEQWALRSDFTYLIPTEGQNANGNVEEGWNVSIGIVWYPGCRGSRTHDYHRPLFNVAGNGTFMVDRD